MIGLLFLNGQPPSQAILKTIDYKSHFIVCADGAYNYLRSFCQPDILVGDFDSLEINEIKAKKIVKLDIKKDFTDGHIAMLELLGLKPDKILIYGASGKDADHELANYSLLYLSSEHGVKSVIVSETHKIYLAEYNFCCEASVGKRVSLVPFTDRVHILDTRGLKYPIRDEIYGKLHIKGISNIALQSEIGYEIKSGAALVFIEI